MNPNLYIPSISIKASELESNAQRRVLIMGPPKWGKTWSALTFPNPIVADFDRGLTEIKRADVITLPFWNDEWQKKNFPPQQLAGAMKGKAAAFAQWLRTEGMKLTSEQTIVVDSLSTLCDALTVELDKCTPIGKTGEKDGFWFWAQWSIWLRDFCTLLCTLQCNVVVICHEQELRDSETGRLVGYKWLLKGQEFSSRLNQFFTDTVRQTRVNTESAGKMSSEYKWQIIADNMFPMCATRCAANTKFITADYKNLIAK